MKLRNEREKSLSLPNKKNKKNFKNLLTNSAECAIIIMERGRAESNGTEYKLTRLGIK